MPVTRQEIADQITEMDGVTFLQDQATRFHVQTNGRHTAMTANAIVALQAGLRAYMGAAWINVYGLPAGATVTEYGTALDDD